MVYAQGFESWKDLHIYFKKSNFLPETITIEELNRLPTLTQLPTDFNELVDETKKWKKLFQPTRGINNTMNKKKSKSFGERLPETTIADKLFRAAAQRAAREAREKRQK